MQKRYMRFFIARALVTIGILVISTMAIAQESTPVRPSGQPKTTKTKALEKGASVIQSHTPLGAMDIYIVGLHPMKDNPQVQMEAHHFCHQVNEDFAQCALFDDNKATANFNGIEYIISERSFEKLPEEEKRYWHPHNYEILSGQLIAPGLPENAEKQMLKGKMNSYGKTWHVWNTGSMGKAGDKLPMGDPHLAWSFNFDGEADPKLVKHVEQKLNINTAQKRRNRENLVPLARPQSGVNALRNVYPDNRKLTPIKGVNDKAETVLIDSEKMTPIPTPESTQ